MLVPDSALEMKHTGDANYKRFKQTGCSHVLYKGDTLHAHACYIFTSSCLYFSSSAFFFSRLVTLKLSSVFFNTISRSFSVYCRGCGQ